MTLKSVARNIIMIKKKKKTKKQTRFMSSVVTTTQFVVDTVPWLNKHRHTTSNQVQYPRKRKHGRLLLLA